MTVELAVLEQVCYANLERGGELGQMLQGRISLGSFKLRDVGALAADLPGEVLLRPPLPLAELAYASAEGHGRVVARLRHPSMLGVTANRDNTLIVTTGRAASSHTARPACAR